MTIPTRTFNGVPGQRSTGTGGPDQLETDLDALFGNLDPAVHGIQTENIKDLNVTTAKIADDAVTTAKINAAAVTATEIASDAVTTVKILDANVTEAKINAGAVTEGKIGAGAVTNTKIGADAVTADKILDGAVGQAELATGAVVEAKIDTGAVTETKIGTGAVTEGKIGALAVTEAKINTGAVTADKIGTGAVTQAKIAADAVGKDEVDTAEVVTWDALVAQATVAIGTQTFTATEGQTLFTITSGTYVTGANALYVAIDGVLQPFGAFTETSTTSFTLDEGVVAGTTVFAFWYSNYSSEIGALHHTQHEPGGSDEIAFPSVPTTNYIINSNFMYSASMAYPDYLENLDDYDMGCFALWNVAAVGAYGTEFPTTVKYEWAQLDPGTLEGASFSYRMLHDGTESGTIGVNSSIQHTYAIENGEVVFDGQTVTFSFLARSDVAGKRLIVVFSNSSYDLLATPQFVTLTTSWARYSVTMEVTAVSEYFDWEYDNPYAMLVILSHWGTSMDTLFGGEGVAEGFTTDVSDVIEFEMTHLSLTIGDTAPDYIPPDPTTELCRELRYYENSKSITFRGGKYWLKTRDVIPTLTHDTLHTGMCYFYPKFSVQDGMMYMTQYVTNVSGTANRVTVTGAPSYSKDEIYPEDVSSYCLSGLHVGAASVGAIAADDLIEFYYVIDSRLYHNL